MPIFSTEDGDSCSNIDLLCSEDNGVLEENSNLTELSYSDNDQVEFSDEQHSNIDVFVDGELDYMPAGDYPARFKSQSLDSSSRRESITWILKVKSFYGFQPLTACLSINYMDRFLSSHCLPQPRGWPLQLLAVACLSLAAKMEEPFVPSLLDFQIEETRYIFEPRTITRMELLVLAALKWRLRAVTPFTFLDYFAYKADPSGFHTSDLISRAAQISLATVHDVDFLDHTPSTIAATAIVCANNENLDLDFIDPATALTWCRGLAAEGLANCYRMIQDVVIGNIQRRPPRILPLFRVTTPAAVTVSMGGTNNRSSSSSSPSQTNKRRKLNNHLWVEGDKES